MSRSSSFKSIKNNHDVYRGNGCMKKLILTKLAMKIIYFKKKKKSYSQTSSRNHMKMQKFAIFKKKITTKTC